MRYLITGGSGFIGSHLVRRLVRRGDTTAIVRPGSTPSRLAGLERDVRILPADVCDGAAVRRIMAEVRPTAVCHLAAVGVTPGSKPADVTAANVLGTYSVLAAIRTTTTVDHAVFVGSWYEYGPALVEDPKRVPRPTSAYGISKFAATLLFQAFASASEVPGLVVRPFQVYGPAEPRHRLIPQVLRGAAAGVPVRLQNPGARRDWVYVEDVAEALEAALDAEADGKVVDIGTGVATSVQDIVSRVLALAGPITVDQEEARVNVPGDSDDARLSGAADVRLARELFGWTAKHDLATGLRKTVDWYRQDGQRIAAP